MAAVFLASLTVVLLSRFFSVRHKCPLISYLIPGIFPLVPGTGIYFTVYAAISGEYMQAVASFVSAFKGGFCDRDCGCRRYYYFPTRYIVWLNGRLQWEKKAGKMRKKRGCNAYKKRQALRMKNMPNCSFMLYRRPAAPLLIYILDDHDRSSLKSSF